MGRHSISLAIFMLFALRVMADSGVILVPTSSDHDISMFVPTLIYNEDSQEFTIDFGEVDEISSGRVVIHDDSGGYQVKNFLVTPACHEFTFTCPLQGTLCITITTPHGDTYAGATGN